MHMAQIAYAGTNKWILKCSSIYKNVWLKIIPFGTSEKDFQTLRLEYTSVNI